MREEIKKFFRGDVLDDGQTLGKYSRDASLFEIRPKLVVYPKDSEDIKNLVKWVNDNKAQYPDLSITARSAGTDMSGGPLNDSIIMDFTKYMNRLLSFDGDKMTVQPGMYYRDFEKIAAERGLMFPSYPASKSICAMGGILANNAGGEKTLNYGKTEDYVTRVKIVLADGNEYEIEALPLPKLQKKITEGTYESEIYKKIYDLITANQKPISAGKPKVSKNSAGYYIWNVFNLENQSFDLIKLIAGSQGTLGIVTEITFKLSPVKKYSKLVVLFMDDLRPLASLVNDILKLKPESFEVYDDKTLKFAIKYFPDFLKGRGVWGSIKFAWSFWPDILMLIRRGLPKLVLLVEFADHAEGVKEKCRSASKIANGFNIPNRITGSAGDANKYWEIRHESFNLLRRHVKGKRTAPFIDDIIVRPEFMPKFLPELNAILHEYKIEYTLAGHAGDGNFHIIPLMDMAKIENQKIITELADKVYDLVIKYKGSITAEHNDGIIRTPYLLKMFGPEMLKIFIKIKTIFDPKDIFNPGKKVGFHKADIEKYLIKSN